MSKRYVVLVVVIGTVLLVLCAPAGAAKSKHRITDTIRVVTVEQSEGYPRPGSTDLILGLEEWREGGKIVRRGVDEGHTTNISLDATGLTFKTDTRAYFLDGTVTHTVNGKVTPQPDGSVSYTGSGKFTGGTGVFKGATGKISYSGSRPTTAVAGVPETVVANFTISY